MHDLVSDLDLSKSTAKILASTYPLWNHLESLLKLKKLRIAQELNKWGLFMDTSEVTLKAVLMINGNKHPSLSLEHSAVITGVLPKSEIAFGGDSTTVNMAGRSVLSSM